MKKKIFMKNVLNVQMVSSLILKQKTVYHVHSMDVMIVIKKMVIVLHV